jgi:hypothetical protein
MQAKQIDKTRGILKANDASRSSKQQFRETTRNEKKRITSKQNQHSN